jgi:hypothetical protein
MMKDIEPDFFQSVTTQFHVVIRSVTMRLRSNDPKKMSHRCIYISKTLVIAKMKKAKKGEDLITQTFHRY